VPFTERLLQESLPLAQWLDEFCVWAAVSERAWLNTLARAGRALYEPDTMQDSALGDGRVVLVSGASGFVGRFACEYLTANNWQVRRLVRRPSQAPDEVSWDPERGELSQHALDGIFGVVHLAGESVNGRWTDAKKKQILQSRVNGTQLLAEAIASAAQPPSVFVSASAIGYYGDRGEELLDESASPSDDYLARVCIEWERAAEPVNGVCRRVHPRIGVVLGPGGGALTEMVRPIRLGVGGVLGTGKQWTSWVSLLDLARLLEFALREPTLQGGINAVAPEPATNAALTAELARLLHRSAWLPAPGFALRLVLGEFATEVLSSKRVVPRAALEAGFSFRHSSVTPALQWSLNDTNGRQR
jgi:uncharacterized protein